MALSQSSNAHGPPRPPHAPHYDAWMAWLEQAGVAFDVHPGLVRGFDHDGPLIPDTGEVADVVIPGREPLTEHRNASAGIAADHATRLVARCLGTHVDVAGQRVLDLGCGTGILATWMTRLGAASVMATDVLDEAVELTRRTGAANACAIEVVAGDMFDGLPVDTPLFDVVAANLPHKPAARGPGGLPVAQAGGKDGTRLLGAMVRDVPGWLNERGCVVTHIHSLADVSLLRDLGTLGSLELLAWRRRVIQNDEYPELMDELRARWAAGTSFLVPYGERVAMISGVWRWDPARTAR